MGISRSDIDAAHAKLQDAFQAAVAAVRRTSGTSNWGAALDARARAHARLKAFAARWAPVYMMLPP